MREPIPKELREQVLNKFGGQCAYCGIQLKKRFHVDHVIPVASGGIDDFANYFPACPKCNAFKNALSLEDFRRILENQTIEKVSFILADRFGQITRHPSKIMFHYEKQGHIFDEILVRELMKLSPRPILAPGEEK